MKCMWKCALHCVPSDGPHWLQITLVDSKKRAEYYRRRWKRRELSVIVLHVFPSLYILGKLPSTTASSPTPLKHHQAAPPDHRRVSESERGRERERWAQKEKRRHQRGVNKKKDSQHSTQWETGMNAHTNIHTHVQRLLHYIHCHIITDKSRRYLRTTMVCQR